MTITFDLDNITDCTDAAPLYSQYPGEMTPQPAYVEMTQGGEVSADFSGEIGNAQPADVWHGVRLHWSVSPNVSGDALADLLRGDALPILERIYAGHSVDWDGSNNVGTLDADATEASEVLQGMLDAMQGDESAIAPTWDVREWLFANGSLSDHWPDSPLAEAVSAIKSEADAEGVQLIGGVQQALLIEALRVYDEDDGNLTGAHLVALVAEREITQAQADEYRADHDIN